MLANKNAIATVAVKDLGWRASCARSRRRASPAMHYDMPGMTRDGDIHIGGDMKVAWFKDPDGNIHNLFNR